MKKIVFTLIFILSLVVNCTTSSPTTDSEGTPDTQETVEISQEEQEPTPVAESADSYIPPEKYRISTDLSDYLGTYLEETYILELQATLSHESAMDAMQRHGVLAVQPGYIQSNVRFHDGYAITVEEFQDFELLMEEGSPVILDAMDNRYLRVSEMYDPYPREVAAFIARTLADNFPEVILLDPGFIQLEENQYRIVLDHFALNEPQGVVLLLVEEWDPYNIVPEGDSYSLTPLDLETVD